MPYNHHYFGYEAGSFVTEGPLWLKVFSESRFSGVLVVLPLEEQLDRGLNSRLLRGILRY